jgi:hypothetical protein
MCAGYPVIATGWSGNMDYMTEENSFPVRYRLVEVDDPQNQYHRAEGPWADPDWEHAALAQRPGNGRWKGSAHLDTSNR